MSQQNDKLASLETKLNSLQSALSEASETALKRKNKSLVIMIILIIFMGGYLAYAHREFSSVDANFVADYLQARFENKLSSKNPDEIKGHLESYAPQVFDQVEKMALQMPNTAVNELEKYIDSVMAQHMPDIEAKITKHLEGVIDNAAVRANGRKDITDKEMQQILDDVAMAYGDHVKQLATAMTGQYQGVSHDVTNYLEVLLNADGLTREQELHRNIFIIVMSEMNRAAKRSTTKGSALVN